MPFLDPEVFAVASRLPYDQKITRTTTKYALRRALEPIKARACAQLRQTGFPVPIRHWLRSGELMDWAWRMIDASQVGHLVDPCPRCAPCSTPTAPARATTQPAAVDGADLPVVVRDLRRGQHRAADQRAAVPGSAVIRPPASPRESDRGRTRTRHPRIV